MLTLKVKEQFWKFQEGRIAPGFKPLERRKFSSCLPNGNLWSPVGYGTDAVDVVAQDIEVSGVSSPLMEEVRAVEICLN